MKHEPVKLQRAVMLALLALSLTACATKAPTPPAVSPPLPPAPSLSTPLPSLSYSATAADVIKTWRQKLISMALTLEPSSKPGQ